MIAQMSVQLEAKLNNLGEDNISKSILAGNYVCPVYSSANLTHKIHNIQPLT